MSPNSSVNITENFDDLQLHSSLNPFSTNPGGKTTWGSLNKKVIAVHQSGARLSTVIVVPAFTVIVFNVIATSKDPLPSAQERRDNIFMDTVHSGPNKEQLPDVIARLCKKVGWGVMEGDDATSIQQRLLTIVGAQP